MSIHNILTYMYDIPYLKQKVTKLASFYHILVYLTTKTHITLQCLLSAISFVFDLCKKNTRISHVYGVIY
jgi:hypothetical protein